MKFRGTSPANVSAADSGAVRANRPAAFFLAAFRSGRLELADFLQAGRRGGKRGRGNVDVSNRADARGVFRGFADRGLII